MKLLNARVRECKCVCARAVARILARARELLCALARVGIQSEGLMYVKFGSKLAAELRRWQCNGSARLRAATRSSRER